MVTVAALLVAMIFSPTRSGQEKLLRMIGR